MLNSPDFVQKLESILTYYQLSASSFADKIGVQRSSISHLLSGRNKPGLEFVIKIVECFPEVDLYWFLMNVGSFPKQDVTQTEESKTIETPKPVALEQKEVEPTVDKPKSDKTELLVVDKIIVLYKDGSFKSYAPQK